MEVELEGKRMCIVRVANPSAGLHLELRGGPPAKHCELRKQDD